MSIPGSLDLHSYLYCVQYLRLEEPRYFLTVFLRLGKKSELRCYEEYAHKASLSLPFLAFSLSGIDFPGEMQREDKMAAQIPWVGLPRLHKKALDLVAGLLWAVNRNQKAILELSHDPWGHVCHIALKTFPSSIFP